MQSKLDSINEKMSIYCLISVCSNDFGAGLLTTIIPVPKLMRYPLIANKPDGRGTGIVYSGNKINIYRTKWIEGLVINAKN